MRLSPRLFIFVLVLSSPAHASGSALTGSPYSAGVIGQDGPSTFYATDVAINDAGVFCVANRYHDNVSCYEPDGTLSNTFSGTRLIHARSLTFDDDRKLYVTDPGDRNIKVFDPEGQLTAAWPEPCGLGLGGITFVAPDRLYLVCAGSKEVLVLDLSGEVVHQVRRYGSDDQPFWNPMDVAVSPDGRIYVSELGRYNRILVFDEDWGFLNSFGQTGAGAGDLRAPISLAVDADGHVYVSERRNYRVSKFDADGGFVTMWGQKGRAPGKFFEHNGISVAPDGTVWTAGYHGNDVQRFDAAGNSLAYYTGHVSGPGDLAKPFGVVEDAGRLFVSDFYNNRIQVFDTETGRYRYEFGERGPETAATLFNFPRAIAQGPGGDLFISDDEFVRRITQDGTFIRLYPRLPDQRPSYPPAVLVQNQTLYQTDVRQNIVILRDIDDPDDWDTWGAPGGVQSFNDPGAIATDPRGRILVGDEPGTIQLFDKHGNKLDEWQVVSTATGYPLKPSSITYDPVHDLLYISTIQEIQAWNLEGEQLHSWSHNGPGDAGIGWIRSIDVDDRGVLYASDFRQNIVNKYVYPGDVSLSGEPEYRIGRDEGVFIWKQTFDGPYVVRANAGDERQKFNVRLMTDEHFVDVVPFRLESRDTLVIEDTSIELSAVGGAHQDGFSFNVPPGAAVLVRAQDHDLGTDSLLRIGQNRMPGILSGWILGKDDLPDRPEYTTGLDSGLFVGVAETGLVEARVMSGRDRRTDELQLFASDPYAEFVPHALEDGDLFHGTSSAATLIAQLGRLEDGIDASVCETCDFGIVYRQAGRLDTRDVNSHGGSLGPPNAVLLPAVTPYDKPGYALNADAVLIWKSGDGMWHVRFTAESRSAFRGSMTSDEPFSSATGFRIEDTDSLNSSEPGTIEFAFQVVEGQEDGIDFSIAPGASLELRLDSGTFDAATLVRVGGQRWPIAGLPLDLSGWDEAGPN